MSGAILYEQLVLVVLCWNPEHHASAETNLAVPTADALQVLLDLLDEDVSVLVEALCCHL